MAWRGRRVFLTGQTGFKGSWLALWLKELGAEVHGYALDPPTSPAIYTVADVSRALTADVRGDVNDAEAVRAAMSAARPELVLHLAAQPLVRESYREPLTTFRTNVIGTANVLDAARPLECVRAIVVITTDKVYHNEEWPHPYREGDRLGGADPYSASKAAAEIVCDSYRASFFRPGRHPAHLATARAGNVIGGGDWADERLVPDCLRALDSGSPIELRFPGAVRPWQHVLEPLSGYLELSERLLGAGGDAYARSWNFGPDLAGEATVGHLAEEVMRLSGAAGGIRQRSRSDALHETGTLRLDSSRARQELGWSPRWSLDEAIGTTVDWHAAWRAGEDMHARTLQQISSYCKALPDA